jgi:hypothetical protein
MAIANSSGREAHDSPASLHPPRIGQIRASRAGLSVATDRRYFAGACTGGGTGDICETFVAALPGPASQLKRSVLSNMKWINNANTSKNTNNPTNALRGSNINHMRHMFFSPYPTNGMMYDATTVTPSASDVCPHGRHCHAKKCARIAITVNMMKLVMKIP